MGTAAESLRASKDANGLEIDDPEDASLRQLRQKRVTVGKKA
jgi:hypothetical protein